MATTRGTRGKASTPKSAKADATERPLSAEDRRIPDPALEPTIKVRRAAAILGISLRHGYACVESGEIPHLRAGERIVIPTRKFLQTFGLLDIDASEISDAA